MSRSDAVLLHNEMVKESDTVYLGLDYAAFCVGINKKARADLVAQVSALMGMLVRPKKVWPYKPPKREGA